jgi:hypothetical protein
MCLQRYPKHPGNRRIELGYCSHTVHSFHYEFGTVTNDVGFEVLTAVVTKITIILNIASCSLYMSRRFGGTYLLHLQGRKSAEQETSVRAGGPLSCSADF